MSYLPFNLVTLAVKKKKIKTKHISLSFLTRCLVEAHWIVPGFLELAAANPAVHAGLRGRATLAVLPDRRRR